MRHSTEVPDHTGFPAEGARFAQASEPADWWMAVAIWASLALALICFAILLLS